jgi:hypothetical protein
VVRIPRIEENRARVLVNDERRKRRKGHGREATSTYGQTLEVSTGANLEQMNLDCFGMH